MDAEFFSVLYQFADVFAFLILSAAGLAIIFGMMGVINMAHGELIMCGAYVTTALVHSGMPLLPAQACGALTAGVVGMILEFTVVRSLYARPLDSLLATWAVSLIVTQGMLVMVGSSFAGVGTPEGSFQVGVYTFSTYRIILFLASIGVLAFIYLLFMKTRFGIHARATMQNAGMARALGMRTNVVYALTFGLGSALAGLCGALYAPTMTLIPTMGATFIVESFVTVVVGGTNVLLGTAPAGFALAVVRTALIGWNGQIAGQIGMLLAVMVMIRVLPNGFSGWLGRWARNV
ncbi:branched-chain amino acid ABC transporter permease [Mesorhizobium sanjuanii]|uniref:Branched-chain amino acid ABC transporter permease n=1 Tax=Mesorhizobium sanjuanii TaxID=2037900 RepID=A0A2A6FLI7_9HYPH|nr:branched-chain amino acid ABC transporter permease [Mesorhizobium sanjuanii]PDQ22694.1 branched-chain amino acid ABC transporter permease [Mesorhizobium sanjuanii]